MQHCFHLCDDNKQQNRKMKVGTVVTFGEKGEVGLRKRLKGAILILDLVGSYNGDHFIIH